MQGAIIKCPPKGSCNINCHANQGCADSTIIADTQTTSLSITASGDQVLVNSNVTCPSDIHYGDCSVSVYGNFINMLGCIDIYAQHSFHDLYFECNYSKDIITNCYNTCNPTIHCNTDHSGSCGMELLSNSISNWQCISSSTDDCSITSIPSLYPSESPAESTKSPSITPSSSPYNPPFHLSTKTPTNNPATKSIIAPSKTPSTNPSKYPSKYPTKYPTEYPTSYTTEGPTHSPSSYPTQDAQTVFGPTSHPSISRLVASSTEIIDSITASTTTTASPSLVTIYVDSTGPYFYFATDFLINLIL